MAASKLTDNERAEIARLLENGLSRAQIARATGRSQGSIDRVAKAIGHRADQSTAMRTRRANEARKSYSAERRAVLAAKACEAAEKLLDELDEPYTVFSFGGRDNTFTSEVLPGAPADVRRIAVQSSRDALRTALEVDRHDNREGEQLAAVDQWLRSLVGESVD